MTIKPELHFPFIPVTLESGSFFGYSVIII